MTKIEDKNSNLVKKIYMPYPQSMMPHPLAKTKKPTSMKEVKIKDKIVKSQKRLGSKFSGKTCRRCRYFGKVKKIHFYICHKSKELFPHGKIPKACRLYMIKPPSPPPYFGPYIEYDKIEGMKFVESLRGSYPNSEFWIIGTDPNLDCYPDNFFDDKLSITLNFACVAFPNSTYFFTPHTGTAKAIVKKLGCGYLGGKCIFIAVARKPTDTGIILWWEDWGLDPIYAKVFKKSYVFGSSDLEQTNEDGEKMIEQLTNDGPFELIDCRSSLNYTIQIVALLGAKKIILVGCSAKGSSLYWHAQRRGMSEWYKETPGSFPSWRSGRPQTKTKQETMAFVRLFKKHNIEVVKHRFDEEKGKFVFEEIKNEDCQLVDNSNQTET